MSDQQPIPPAIARKWYEEGWTAADQNDVGDAVNPYPEGSPGNKCWQEGHDDCLKEQLKP